MHWTWSAVKAASNLKKHGVSFGMAEQALGDPLALTEPAPYPNEERWQTLALPAPGSTAVLFIVHTWPDDSPGRIISARMASPAERRTYYDGR